MISIVIPLYNKEKEIEATLQSVLSQNFQDYEIVIVDDGSVDKSAQIVKGMNDPHIRYIYQQNAGPSAARNHGVGEAKADWILFLDADDRLEPGALQMFEDLRIQNPNSCIFSANFYLETEGKKELLSQKPLEGIVPNNFLAWFSYDMILCAGSVMYKRTLLQSVRFREDLRRYEDAEMQFQLMRNYKIYHTYRPSVTYNLGSASASKGRPTIKEDFVGYIKPRGKSFWEKMVLYRMYEEAQMLYPDEFHTTYPKNPFSKTFMLMRKIIPHLPKCIKECRCF